MAVDAAMTADVNGYSWSYAQCLADAGVDNLFSCVHTHHGMFPIGKKQTPFYWETPKGDRVLVWNGDHYHLGNELGFAPDALNNYVIQDEFKPQPIDGNEAQIRETRIYRYLKQLEAEGYPYDFVPIAVSGLITDNAPPSTRIVDTMHAWNQAHGQQVRIEMITLSQLFAKVRSESADIPAYRGDWPDWWSDGVASTASATQIFRDANGNFVCWRNLIPGMRR